MDETALCAEREKSRVKAQGGRGRVSGGGAGVQRWDGNAADGANVAARAEEEKSPWAKSEASVWVRAASCTTAQT